ncbi:MAG: M20/M25/M40 family metallo-hydrolase [Clostridia bacterium]|nr:M20/M25/M40 family metallo-hydrolase [Clostridia bacterium]
MDCNLTKEVTDFLDNELAETHRLLKELTLIPAPSHHEDERAAYIKKWLEEIGAEGAYIDEAKNVIYKLEGENKDDAVVFMAHTDTVFPMETPLVWREDEENYYCPGVGDDTCSVALLLTVLKYVVQTGLKPKRTVLFVANSCEEGLGNLKGSKQIVKDFGHMLSEFYSLDGKYPTVYTRCVGSHRYKIKATTEGGHSYAAFGNTNAIVELAKLVAALDSIEVPVKENAKTTYNVGTISGGTSVNTIAQFAEMTYEYRSDDRDCLAIMKAAFEEALAKIKKESKASFAVELIGERGCDGDVDKEKHERMIARTNAVYERLLGKSCVRKSASTDCNSASAAGIPSICLGVYGGGGAHTREEWVEKKSIATGLKITAALVLDNFLV